MEEFFLNASAATSAAGSGLLDFTLASLYDDLPSARARYAELSSSLSQLPEIGDKEVFFFRVPGRIELCGNHLDHQQGHVIAAAIDRDIAACAAATEGDTVTVRSAGYPTECVSLSTLSPDSAGGSCTGALLRGVLFYLREHGYRLGPFSCCTRSQIPGGAGLSSSAAFEVLIGLVISHLYNGGTIPLQTLAEAGRFAENEFLGKPSGLMDQLACATGGVVLIDLAEKPTVRQLPALTTDTGHSLVIVEAGDSHAALGSAYASIVEEMASVARFFGKRTLREVGRAAFFDALPDLLTLSDRAVLRAFHYFEEFDRVTALAGALRSGHFEASRQILRKSGLSSLCFLQNGALPGAAEHQPVPLVLAVCEHLLGDCGAYRLHGGGFGGTVLALVPDDQLPYFLKAFSRLFGEGRAYPVHERAAGAILLPSPNR